MATCEVKKIISLEHISDAFKTFVDSVDLTELAAAATCIASLRVCENGQKQIFGDGVNLQTSIVGGKIDLSNVNKVMGLFGFAIDADSNTSTSSFDTPAYFETNLNTKLEYDGSRFLVNAEGGSITTTGNLNVFYSNTDGNNIRIQIQVS